MNVLSFCSGVLVDSACLLFSGSCRIYKNSKLAVFVLVFVSVAKVVGLILALFSHRTSLRLRQRSPEVESPPE